MSQKTSYLFRLPVLILLLFISDFAEAQRRVVTYESLLMRDRQPNVFFDNNVFPPDEDNPKAAIQTGFTVEYNFLRFRRVRPTDNFDNDKQFVTDVEITVDYFKLDGPPQPTERRSRWRSNDEPEDTGLRVGNRTWRNQVFAKTYEETQSRTRFLEGILHKDLEPGYYRLIITLRADGRSRGNVTRIVNVPDFTKSERAQIYFLNSSEETDSPSTDRSLINLGSIVHYGQDFSALIRLPETAAEDSILIRINKVNISSRDTTMRQTVFESTFSPDEVLKASSLRPENDALTANVRINLDSTAAKHHLLFSNIPNSSFPNSRYALQVLSKNESGSKQIGQKFFENRWFDMPISLLNIDVAISMMRFIISEEEHAAMRRGSSTEKEQKFREFWDARNPTPETEYNELMVEFFRRVDIAFERFTTPTTPGYETDQGRIFIRNGEPNRIDRRFPANQPAVEVWHYGNRQFVFRATTGFGDYELIERR